MRATVSSHDRRCCAAPGACRVVECIGDGVIMKGGTELRCEGVRALGVSPGVHLGIQACGVVAGAIELDRVVGASSVRVKGQIGQPWEQQRARGAQMIFNGRGEHATEEDGAVDRPRAARQLVRSGRPTGRTIRSGCGSCRYGIEVGEALDVDQAAVTTRTAGFS